MAKFTAIVGKWRIDIAESGTIEVYENGTLCSNSKGALREIANHVGFKIQENWNTRQTGRKLVDAINSGNAASQESEKEEISEGKSYTLNEQFAALAYRIMSDDGKIYQEEIDGMLSMANSFDKKLDLEKVKELFAMERTMVGLGLDSPIGDIDEILYSVRDEDKKDLFLCLNWVAMSDWEFTQSKIDLLKDIGTAWGFDILKIGGITMWVKAKLEEAYPNRGEIEMGI